MKILIITKNKLIFVLFVAGIVVGGLNFLSSKFQESKNSEMIHVLESYVQAQESYHEVYKEYSIDKKSLGFSADSERVTTFFSKEEIPLGYLPQIPKEAIPFIEKNSFKVLCLFGKNNDKMKEMWTVDNSRKIIHVGKILIE